MAAIDSQELRRRLLAGEDLPAVQDLVILHRSQSGARRISNIRRDDDGSTVCDVDDIEGDETGSVAPVVVQAAAPANAARIDHAGRPAFDPFMAVVGDPEWTLRHN